MDSKVERGALRCSTFGFPSDFGFRDSDLPLALLMLSGNHAGYSIMYPGGDRRQFDFGTLCLRQAEGSSRRHWLPFQDQKTLECRRHPHRQSELSREPGLVAQDEFASQRGGKMVRPPIYNRSRCRETIQQPFPAGDKRTVPNSASRDGSPLPWRGTCIVPPGNAGKPGAGNPSSF